MPAPTTEPEPAPRRAGWPEPDWTAEAGTEPTSDAQPATDAGVGLARGTATGTDVEPATGAAAWTVVVPVKRLAAAKSRLRGAVDGVPHETLALALALDTVAAVLACTEVREALVVTSDTRAGAALRRIGARVVPDGPAPGLNAALTRGASLAAPGWVAALTADLPALRPAELAAALRAAAAPLTATALAHESSLATAPKGAVSRQDLPPSATGAATGEPRTQPRTPVAADPRTPVAAGARRFVADAPGDGTVLLTAAPGVPLDPQFGPGSATAHARSGALALVGEWPTLRRDVDTPADLAAAAALGLGPHTAALGFAATPRR